MTQTVLASRPLSRRMFLKGTGVALTLPWLEVMGEKLSATGAQPVPRRMVAIETNMGILPQYFFPRTAGRRYELTPYLDKLAAVRDDFTVFSGTSYPGVTGFHAAEKCFLTGAPHPEGGTFRNTISLDQFAAEQVGHHTRFPSLVLSAGADGLSYSRSGAPIPTESSPRRLFQRLFVQGTAQEVASSIAAINQRRSVLDFVAEPSEQLDRTLSAADRQRLDQYFTSVRELERRLAASEQWESRPKPVVNAPAPQNDRGRDPIEWTANLLELVKLALETDSTRIVTLYIDTSAVHNLTHHGNRPEVIDELKNYEERQFEVLGGFLRALKNTAEAGQPLLDRTMVLYGTCMGNANSHDNRNLPVLLAGGGFRHGQHLAFDTQNNYPLSNLYVSMLQRLGIETNEFSTGRGTFRGLEMA